MMVHNIDAVLGVYYFGLHLWLAVFGDSADGDAPPLGHRDDRVRRGGRADRAAARRHRRGTGQRTDLRASSRASRATRKRPGPTRSRRASPRSPRCCCCARRSAAWLRWAWYALALAAAGAANLIALCVLAGHAVAVVAACWQRTASSGGVAARSGPRSRPGWPGATLAGFCLSAIAAIVLDAPIVIEGRHQSLSQIGQQQTPSLVQLTGLRGGLWSQLFCSTPVAVAILVLAVASVAVAPRRAAPWCGLALAVVPIVAVWLISHGPASYWVVRYMLFSVQPGPCRPDSAWRVSPSGREDCPGPRVLRLPQAGVAVPLRSAVAYAVAVGLVATTGLLGVRDQQAIRQPEAHNPWAYPLSGGEWKAGGLPWGGAGDSGTQRLPMASRSRSATRTTTRSTPASPITCAASPYPRRSSRPGRRPSRTPCSRSSAPTRHAAAQASPVPRGSGWSTSTTWCRAVTETRCSRSRRMRRPRCGRRATGSADLYPKDGITVALLVTS